MTFWSYYYLKHVCAVPKSRINDHFYSYCKDTAEKARERLFTSAATNLTFSPLQRLFWSLTLDLSYSWNKINA